jgi:hypothetical protein
VAGVASNVAASSIARSDDGTRADPVIALISILSLFCHQYIVSNRLRQVAPRVLLLEHMAATF